MVSEKQTKIADRLGALLADIHQLYIKTLAYHWNVEDPRFLQLHELFEKQYKQLAEQLDLVAEQIRIIGKLAPGSLREFAKMCRLQDTELVNSGDEMIAVLVADYETVVASLREDIIAIEKFQDAGTVDLLTELLREYEKSAWFLKSHLTD